MSIQLMADIFNLNLSPGLKLLLLSLADNANDAGHAWPSQDTLAIKVSATTRSVRTQTGILEAEDWLSITEAAGRGHGIHYYLNVEKIREEATIRKAEVGEIKAEKAEVGVERRKLTTRKAEVGVSGNHQEPSQRTINKENKNPYNPPKGIVPPLPSSDMRVCSYCGCGTKDDPRGGFTWDHFLPQSEGGLEGENLILSCNACNNIKGKAIFDTIEEARLYIHKKLWSKPRQRWIDHRQIAFDGLPPPFVDNHFQIFYQLYPLHVSRVEAEKAWTKLRPSPDLVDTILQAVKAQTASIWRDHIAKKELQYIPYPATWLRGQKWDDEIPDVSTDERQNGNKAPGVDAREWIRRHGLPGTHAEV